MKRGALIALLTSLAFAAWGSQGVQPRYGETKGIREFSGSLLVRPLQFDTAVLLSSSYEAPYLFARSHMMLATRGRRLSPGLDIYVLPIPKGRNENSYSSEFAKTGLVEFAEPNWRLFPAARPNDKKYPFRSAVDPGQWYHKMLQSERAWDITTARVPNIAVVDTGVDPAHPDLSLSPGYHIVNGVGLTQAQGGDVSDVSGHGTLVAGAAAAKGNNTVGVCGMAWNCAIVPVRATDNPDSSALLSDLLAGAVWAVDSGSARIVNVSYELANSPSIELTGQYIDGAGGFLVWSAGNGNADLGSPYDLPNVIIVGATDQTDQKASFSNYGQAIDMFAPGVSVLTTARGGGYQYFSGTSVAAPLVSGLLAMMRAVNLNLTTALLRQSLEHGCKDLGTLGEDNCFGWGRINSYESTKRVVPYNFQSLPLPNGLQYSTVFSINSLGDSVGYASGSLTSGFPRALLWPSQGGVAMLPLLSGLPHSMARSINDGGKIVGHCISFSDFNTQTACLWDGATVTALTNPLSAPSFAAVINSSGQIAGGLRIAGFEKGVCWTGVNGAGPVVVLDPLPGFDSSNAEAMNNAGIIVGRSYIASQLDVKATYWAPPNYTPVDLAASFPSTAAYSINNAGAIGGVINDAVLGVRHATLFSIGGPPVSINELPGVTSSDANRYNDVGQIAGNLVTSAQRGAIWNNGNMQRLEDLKDPNSQSGLSLISGRDINVKGHVIGYGEIPSNSSQAYIGVPLYVLGQTSINVASSVYLEDFLGDSGLRPVTFQLKQGTVLVETVPNVTPDIDGVYRFQTLARGTYDVYASADYFLTRKIPAITFADSGVSPALTFTMKNGDVDMDNDIDKRDLKKVRDSLLANSLIGDMNGDGAITYADVAIVKKNQGKAGD